MGAHSPINMPDPYYPRPLEEIMAPEQILTKVEADAQIASVLAKTDVGLATRWCVKHPRWMLVITAILAIGNLVQLLHR